MGTLGCALGCVGISGGAACGGKAEVRLEHMEQAVNQWAGKAHLQRR